MNDHGIGAAVRVLRTRRRKRQEDVAAASGVPRAVVIAIEAGRLGRVTIDRLRAVAAANGAWLELRVRSPAGDVQRLLDAGHAVLQEVVIQRLRAAGWQVWPEVSFSIFGERGVIDILAWHAATRTLLIIEIKTLLVDFGDLLATMDRRLRLAWRIAADRGLAPLFVGGWVAVRDTATNRRRLSDHVALVRAAFPEDGRTIGAWLRHPSRALRALSFLSDVRDRDLSHGRALPRRVRKPVAQDPRRAAERQTTFLTAAKAVDRPIEPRVGTTFRR